VFRHFPRRAGFFLTRRVFRFLIKSPMRFEPLMRQLFFIVKRRFGAVQVPFFFGNLAQIAPPGLDGGLIFRYILSKSRW